MATLSSPPTEAASARRRQLLKLLPAGVLPGCASLTLPGESDEPPPPQRVGEWVEVPLPGKRRTHYRLSRKDGRESIEAHAQQSASMLRRRWAEAQPSLSRLHFSWWVPELIAEADVTRADSADAPARVLLAFGGDHARLTARNRMLFDLAEGLTGERPPFATLAYVWERHAPLEAVIHNARTDRIRKIVVDSGPTHLGRWREHRRDVRADYQRAFGEDPGPLLSIALMTDADNTASVARAWYGPVVLS